MAIVLPRLQTLFLQFCRTIAKAEKMNAVSIFTARKGVKARNRSTLGFMGLFRPPVREDCLPFSAQNVA